MSRDYPVVPATLGLLIEDRASEFCGDVVAVDARAVTLRDRDGKRREFLLKPGGFLIEGKPVTLVRPTVKPPPAARVTNSGSVKSATTPARTARASRIWVEGRHDAELLEHVWGDDLRELGIVVEPMHGIDELVEMVAEGNDALMEEFFDQGTLSPEHLVQGLKEALRERRMADAATLFGPGGTATAHAH